MNQIKPVRLNIGAGLTYIPGFTNIDISSNADISLDLGKDKLPFKDDSVDLIFSYHTLEHIPNYIFVLSEIHRVLKNGGLFLVGVPYVTLTEYHLVNPFHLHNFNEFSFDFFNGKELKGTAVEENEIFFEKIFHRFHYIGLFNIIPPPFRTWCRRHLLNVVRKIDFGLIAVKDSNSSTKPYSNLEAIRQFNECINSRLPYEESVVQNQGVLRGFLRRLSSWWQGYSNYIR